MSKLSCAKQLGIETGCRLMRDRKGLRLDAFAPDLSGMLGGNEYQTRHDLRYSDNLTILLLDQEIRYALRIAGYAYVPELRRNKLEGPPSEVGSQQKAVWVA